MTTLIIIAITCVISFMAFSNQHLIAQLILWPPAVKRGEYYRLLSYGLIHADGTHLLWNMFALYSFGSAMEPIYGALLGPFGFVLLYLSATVVSILPSYFANRDNSSYRSLGASGAVSALVFASILFQPWGLILLFGIIPIPSILFAVGYVAYSIYMDRRMSDNVNHSAHLWGAAYGVLFTIALAPRVLGFFLQQLSHPSFHF